MKNKWKHRVYMDLFSGPGRVRFGQGGPSYDATPLIALAAGDPFDRYILGDANPEALTALQKRIARAFPAADVRFVKGETSTAVGEALAQVPKPGVDNTVLTFCVLDPYDISSLQFTTIRAISQIFVDFFVLIASDMDAGRNWRLYQESSNPTVDLFLGRPDWREEWAKPEVRKDGFGSFIMLAFVESMKREGFSLGMIEHIRLPKKRVPLYHLAGFSKHKVGLRFWKEAQRLSDAEALLPFGP